VRCEGTESWRDELIGKRFTSIDSEIGIRRVLSNKNKEMRPKTGLYQKNTKINGKG
jgi:hypothetical protein